MGNIDRLRARAAFLYLLQRSRIIPYGRAGRFDRSEALNRTFVVLPVGDGGKELRLPIDGTPPPMETHRLTVVSDPDGGFQLFYTGADTEVEAEQAMDEMLVEYVVEEVGAVGLDRMVRQLIQRGPAARLNPRSNRQRYEAKSCRVTDSGRQGSLRQPAGKVHRAPLETYAALEPYLWPRGRDANRH